jgi:hypothetical protein
MTGIVVLPKCYPPSSRETHDNIDTTVFKLLSMTCKKTLRKPRSFSKEKMMHYSSKTPNRGLKGKRLMCLHITKIFS